MVEQLITRTKVLAVTAVMAFVMLASAATTIVASRPVSAATSCDKVNIIYCGVNKGGIANDISSVKDHYNSNKSGHKASPSIGKDYTDIRDVYAWAGATGSMVNGMSTTNTKLGTLYRDGRIVVDGKTVATDSWVTARFSEGAGFKHVVGNVYARKTTTSFANASAAVLVNFQNGKMAFAVMTDCGNLVKGTPKTPPKTPKPEMSCDLLTLSKKSDTEYGFTAKASVKNATIKSYDFDFGDGQNKIVPSTSTTASTEHKYAKPGTYAASVKVTFVAGGKTKVISSAKCTGEIKIGQPECKPGIPVGDERCEEKPVYSCNELLITPADNNSKQYNFTVKATAENAKIDGYIVDFGDGSAPYEGTTPSVDHAYAKPGTYTAKASIKVTAKGKTEVVTGTKCAGKVAIEQPMCETPGKEHLPVDSPECLDTPETPETPQTPPAELPKTGAGSMIGLFSGFSIAGTAAHRLFVRRRNS